MKAYHRPVSKIKPIVFNNFWNAHGIIIIGST